MALPANFGKPWSTHDLQYIHHQLINGLNYSTIAQLMMRGEGEVIRKVRELAVNLFIDGFMSKDMIATATGLTLEQVEDAIREYTMLRAREQVRIVSDGGGGGGGSIRGFQQGPLPTPTQTAPAPVIAHEENIQHSRQSGEQFTNNALAHLAVGVSDALKHLAHALDEFARSYGRA